MISSPTSTCAAAGSSSFGPVVSPEPSPLYGDRPWEGRMFSGQYKAVSVSLLCVHLFTLWDSVNVVLEAGRVQLESLYGRRVVLSLPYEEVTQCTRDTSRWYRGKRARVHIRHMEAQWVLDLFEESDADAFYALLTRALVTVGGQRVYARGGQSLLPLDRSSSQLPLPPLPSPETSRSETEWGHDGDAPVDEFVDRSASASLGSRCPTAVQGGHPRFPQSGASPLSEGSTDCLLHLFPVISPYGVDRSNDTAAAARLRLTLHRPPVNQSSPPSSPTMPPLCVLRMHVL